VHEAIRGQERGGDGEEQKEGADTRHA
jgi:hypothetical protein